MCVNKRKWLDYVKVLFDDFIMIQLQKNVKNLSMVDVVAMKIILKVEIYVKQLV